MSITVMLSNHISNMSKAVAKVWAFASSSNTATRYETLQYSDGCMSCNCPGWTRRTATDGTRSCRHTRLVDMDRASIEALSFHDYTQQKHAPPPSAPLPKTRAKKAVPSSKIKNPYARKLCL
jgi:hypothetical protein